MHVESLTFLPPVKIRLYRIAALFTALILVHSSDARADNNVEIWDNGASAFTDTFANGDSIGNGTGNQPNSTTNMVTDSQGRVYVGYRQSNGTAFRLYLVRYDRTDVAIWDNDASTFTDTFANGDPIDNGTNNDVEANGLAMAVDSQDRVYMAFIQFDGSRDHLYLTRYDGTDVKIWDNDASTFTDTFTDGDPIDNGPTHSVYSFAFDNLDMEVDSQDRVYIAFYNPMGVTITFILLAMMGLT